MSTQMAEIDRLCQLVAELEKERDELAAALRDAEEWLQWASGAFDTDEKSKAWMKCGLPALDRIGTALKRTENP